MLLQVVLVIVAPFGITRIASAGGELLGRPLGSGPLATGKSHGSQKEARHQQRRVSHR